MLCKEYEHLMVDYLAGELSHTEKTMLMAHISKCPECAELFTEYRRVITESKRIDIPFPDVGAWEKMLPAIKETRSHRIRILKPVVALGVMFVIVSLFFVRLTDNGKNGVAINIAGNNGYGAVLSVLPYPETSFLDRIEDIDDESASDILELVFNVPISPLYE